MGGANDRVGDFPRTGLVRLWQILGKKGHPGVIPISKSSWWAGIKTGRYPKPVKLSQRCTCWYAEDIWALIAREEPKSNSN